ncbi:hypothetical protein [Hymenobacter crusticola]|uniref:Uncharacterized protein n=1 Tax=Hymenobacter crusticola TaxID=1770526 RepID=A0A243W721_9BACT|nr:hypothetical protein [Hymenobacter crusticola]OUJ68660.1 hypothetical protein BXP70_27620 [Hymenobacter crusticola]
MTSAIVAWLAQPKDFAAGVALYEAYGPSAVYQHLFRQGETTFARTSLVRELHKLVATPAPAVLPKQPELVPERHETVPKPADVEPEPPAVDPAALAHVNAQLKALRDERSHKHAQLTAPGLRQNDRRKLAFRILDIGDEVLETMQLLKHVLAHGSLPAGPVATVDVTDAGELRRRLDNLVALRSKVRKNPKRAAELPAMEKEIKLIRAKLKS